jgi:NADP-dependent 3-hydroxy acid dehydrogenase YdfG
MLVSKPWQQGATAMTAIVVTGAAQGTGRAVAELRSKEGHPLFVVDTDAGGMAEVAQALPGDVETVPGSVADAATAEAATRAAGHPWAVAGACRTTPASSATPPR